MRRRAMGPGAWMAFVLLAGGAACVASWGEEPAKGPHRPPRLDASAAPRTATASGIYWLCPPESDRPRPAPAGPFLSALSWAGTPAGPAAAHAVILIHGLDEPGGVWDDLAPALQQAGYAVARFEYPNDGAIGESAALLAGHLRELRREGTRQVDLVCHSMGGLVARDCLTRTNLYGGRARGHDDLPDVQRLITLGTPNLGSGWVRYRAVSEWRERLLRAIDREDWRQLDLADPLSRHAGANADLKPGSEFLRDLNARPLPAGVAVTIVAARITDEEKTQWMAWTQDDRLASALGPERLARWAAAGRTLLSDLGDGVVPLDSTSLPGVRDYVLLTANHRSMIRRLAVLDQVAAWVDGGDAHALPPAVPVVLDRLQRPVP